MTPQEIKILHTEADHHALHERQINQMLKELTAEKARIQARIYEIARALPEYAK
jgi:hypothetical protein